MKFRAWLDRGQWANDLEKLREATGKTMETLLREQTRLLVRDCIMLTPPCEKRPALGRYKIAARLKEQFEIGKKAVVRDVMRIFVPHESRKVFSITGRKKNDDFANRLAKIAVTGDVGTLNKTLKAARYQSSGSAYSKIAKHADMQDHKDRYLGRGRVKWKNNRVLLHDGNAQPFNPTYGEPEGWKTNSSVARIAEALIAKVGLAKAGWVEAAKALKLPLPAWIKRNAKGAGVFRVEGAGTPKVSITVGSTVPYMQEIGGSLRIVERAWEERKTNLRLQQHITRHGKHHGLFKTSRIKRTPKTEPAQEQA